MADKDLDKPENKGLKALAGKYFGPDSHGTSLGMNIGEGIFRGLRWGKESNSLPNYAMPFAATVLVCEVIALGYGGGVNDVSVPADPAMAVRTEAAAQGYNALRFQNRNGDHLYLLTRTDAGYRLYSAPAGAGTDVRFLPVTKQMDAWRTVGEIARSYTALANAMAGDVTQIPDNIPATVGFERVSPLYQGTGETFRIGDNMADSADAPQFTVQDARNAADFWTRTATAIAAGEYASGAVQGVQDAPAWREDGLGSRAALWGQMVLLGYAGFATLGLAGGVISGVAASRRRAGRQNTKTLKKG